jgi:hypothetical protein
MAAARGWRKRGGPVSAFWRVLCVFFAFFVFFRLFSPPHFALLFAFILRVWRRAAASRAARRAAGAAQPTFSTELAASSASSAASSGSGGAEESKSLARWSSGTILFFP